MITLIRDHFDNWPLLILTDACIHADQHRTVLSESLRHPLHDDYIDPWLLRHLTAAPSDRCLHIYTDQYRTISRENLRHLLENKQSSVKTQRAWELFCDRWCELRCLVAPRLPSPPPRTCISLDADRMRNAFMACDRMQPFENRTPLHVYTH